jgi:hypothetical protein
MSDTEKPQLTPKQNLGNIEAVRDLFARSHDYIAQASHPGHMGMKVAEVLNFLKFQYDDFKLRAENLAKQIEAEAKAELSKVDVEAAKLATDAVLSDTVAAPASMSDEHGAIDAPKP